jgi:signal transduction histidine kinase/ActR/RegA family two-component response regulator
MPMPPIRIRTKIVIAITALVVLIFALFITIVHRHIEGALMREVGRSGLAVTTTFSQMATPFILASDYISVLDTARQAVAASEIKSISIWSVDGRKWLSTDDGAPQKLVLQPFHKQVIQARTPHRRHVQTDTLNCLEITAPIIALSKVRYLLTVEYALTSLNRQLSRVRREVLLLSIGMLALAMGLGIALSRVLTSPLKALLNGTRALSDGNLDFRIDRTSSDEIGELALAFNQMAGTLRKELGERRQAELALRQHGDELEARVAERTRELRRAVTELRRENIERKIAENRRANLAARLQRARKMEALGTLAGGVAHDLNNILSAIVTYPDLLLLQLPEDSPMVQSLTTIRESGLKAGAIVQDLLTLARRGVTARQVLDLGSLVQTQIGSPEFQRLMDAHPLVRLETDLPGGLSAIEGSKVHIAKAVMNLAANAVEAIEAGGCFKLATREVRCEAPTGGYEKVPPGDYVVLSVEDDGRGIEPQVLDRIFEPFYTTKTMGRSGTGLGMALVWGTVKDHGGFIDIQSKTGAGTRFDLYLPATSKSQQAESAPLPTAVYMGRGERILVVDDVAEQREIAGQILSALGYQVTAVASGEACVAHLETHPIDLVILDMLMPPGIDGLETYGRIVRRHPGQKAIIVSGFSHNERVRQAQRLGAGKFIQKPYRMETLGRAVRRELDRDEGDDAGRKI